MEKEKKTGEEILEDMKTAAGAMADAAGAVVDAAKPVAKKAVKTGTDAAHKVRSAAAPAAKKAAKAGNEAAQKTADAVRRSTPKKPEYYVQFEGREVDMGVLSDRAKAAFRQANRRTAVMSCRIYVKPEDSAAYYVINDTFFGRLDL